MAIVASQLIAKVGVEGDTEAKARLESVGKTSDATSSSMGDKLLGATMLAGAGLLALGVKAAQMAGNFQAGLTSLVTGAGESAKNIKLVGDSLLQMSVDTGTSTDQLISGMYMIESAGYHGAAGLAVLQAAAEGAKVGNADLGTVADGVTTIMTDYARSHVSAAQATNLLVATVAAGKTHMQDLASSMAMILPTAASMRVHLQDIAGAMATMTGEGVPAADAATYLRQMLMALENPASKAKSVLKEIGLTSTEVSDAMQKSLPGALQLIVDHLKKKFPEGSAAYVAALAAIAGGSKQMQGMLDLTGDHLGVFKQNVDGISDSVKKGGAQISGWSEVQKDFNFKLDQTHAMFNKLLIKLGTDLMPVVSDFMTKYVQPLIQNFLDWTKNGNNLHDMFQNVENVLGPLVVDFGNFVQFMTSGNPLATDLRVVLGGIVAIVAAQKIGQMATDFKNFALSTLDFVNNIGPKMIEFFTTGLPGAAKKSQDAEIAVGMTAKTTMAEDVGAGAAVSEAEIAGVGTAADTAKVGVTGLGTSLLGIVGLVASVATIEMQLGMWLHDSGIIPDVNKITNGHDINPSWVTHKPPNNTSNAAGTGDKLPSWVLAPSGQGVSFQRHATGTSFAPGGPSLLGEREPELVMGPSFANLARGSQVIPLSQMSAPSPGAAQPVHLHIYVGGQNVANAFLPDLAQALRSGLGVVGI